MGPEGYALIQDLTDEADIAVRTSLSNIEGNSLGVLSASKVAENNFNVEFVDIKPLHNGASKSVLKALSDAGLLDEPSDQPKPESTDKPSLKPVPSRSGHLRLRDVNYPLSK